MYEFASDDRFDANLVRRIYEMHCAKNISMVGHSHGGHAKLMDALDEFFNVASAVKQRIIAVQM